MISGECIPKEAGNLRKLNVSTKALSCPTNLQDVVNDITTWAVNNNMKLNISKCKKLIIDFAKDKIFSTSHCGW